MRCQPTLLILVFFGFLAQAWGQEIALMVVNPPKEKLPAPVPVSVDLDQITYLADSALALVASVNKQAVPLNLKIKQGEKRTLNCMPDQSREGKRIYKLSRKSSANNTTAITAHMSDGTIVLANADRPLLQYTYAALMPT